MNLQRNVWFVRWFHFVQGVIGSMTRYENGTNLCHFIRVCFLWGGLLTIFVTLLVTAIFALLFVLPFYGFWLGPAVVGFLVTAFTLAYGALRLAGYLGSRNYNLAPEGSALRCAIEYSKAVKGRFCPMIKFD